MCYIKIYIEGEREGEIGYLPVYRSLLVLEMQLSHLYKILGKDGITNKRERGVQVIYLPMTHLASLVVPLSSQLVQALIYTISTAVEVINTVPLSIFSYILNM